MPENAATLANARRQSRRAAATSGWVELPPARIISASLRRYARSLTDLFLSRFAPSQGLVLLRQIFVTRRQAPWDLSGLDLKGERPIGLGRAERPAPNSLARQIAAQRRKSEPVKPRPVPVRTIVISSLPGLPLVSK